MKRFSSAHVGPIAFLALLVALAGTALGGEIHPGLEDILSSTPPGEPVSVLVFLNDQVGIEAMNSDLTRENATLHYRHETVVRRLQETANDTQGDIVAYLDALKAKGGVDEYRVFWIVNAVEVTAERGDIEAIAGRPEVARVYYNYEIEPIDPVDITAGDPGAGTAVENGVAAVRAPEVWAMGYTGVGVLVANIDTGVEGDHPALASRWAGVADTRYAGHPEWAWYDPYLGQNDFPYDYNGHGTHTMGTICGGAPGDEVGVAPGAYWMAAGAIDRGGGIERTVADAILSFQWMLDPDGDPGTSWDVPDVCSNSWGVVTAHGYPPCDELFWSYIDACEAAGTVVIFAAGNEGTSGLRRPGDRATDDYRNCAVAAVDGNTSGWPIAYFSSRGPTYCTPGGGAAIKPDIAAPGVSVRSAYPGGGYASMSGTSMATPHIAGVIALMREANPNLGVDEIKQILYETAYDLGSAGEDNAYGWGMVDAYEAVLLALGDTLGPVADFVGSPTSGCVPLSVQFTDSSTGDITSWDWDFGDGGTSTQQNPLHVYQNAGTYSVTLTVTAPEGSDTEIKTDYIVVYDVPVADFVGSPDSGSAPLTVTFTDLSTGGPTSWSWDFGDGGGSSEQNPTYTYTNPGTYTVTLIAGNSCGSDTATKVDYITVTEEVVLEVHVSDIVVTRATTGLAGKLKYYGIASVAVVDQYDQPVANATVSGFFNAPQTKTVTGVTGGNGVAQLQSKSTPRPPGDWCFEVTDISHATHTYDPAANVVTAACESGPVYRLGSAIANVPREIGLSQNYPNPFNPVTEISFVLPSAAHAKLEVFNSLGQRVSTLVDGPLDRGEHVVQWDGTDAASGVYFYRLQTADFVETKRMVLLK